MTKLPPGEVEQEIAVDKATEAEPVSIADLQKQRQVLEAKVMAAQRVKQEDLRKKLSDRESLVREVPRLDALVTEATKTLDYYLKLDESGLLVDSKDKAGLEGMRQMVTDLQKQRDQALKSADLLMKQPEVNAAVVGEAEKEGQGRDFDKAVEAAKKDLYQQIEGLIQECQPLAEKQQSLQASQNAIDTKFQHAYARVKQIVDEAIIAVHSRKFFGDDLVPHHENSESYAEYIGRLQGLREKLGMFAPKEKKKALDTVLQPGNREAFKNADATAAEKDRFWAELKKVEQEVAGAGQKYREIILGAWKKQKGITEKYPDKQLNKQIGNQGLAYLTDNHIHTRLSQLGDVKRYDEQSGKTIEGRFGNLEEALKRNPALNNLSYMVSKVREAGGGSMIVYTEPVEEMH